jgi:hypothetical protein
VCACRTYSQDTADGVIPTLLEKDKFQSVQVYNVLTLQAYNAICTITIATEAAALRDLRPRHYHHCRRRKSEPGVLIETTQPRGWMQTASNDDEATATTTITAR